MLAQLQTDETQEMTEQAKINTSPLCFAIIAAKGGG
jgi:hypothetical protein